jgi:hypothetical protein
MAQDRRTEIEEPRLLRAERRLVVHDARLGALEQRDREPLLRARYLIEPESALNPNIVSGREWLASTVGAYAQDETATRGIDGRIVITIPGYYEVHGFIVGSGSAAAMSMQIRKRQSGVTGRVVGGVANTRLAGVNVYGWFNWQDSCAEGDTLSIITERIDGAGTFTPWVEASRPGSWIEVVYRSVV